MSSPIIEDRTTTKRPKGIVADNLESPCLNVNALWGRGIMRMCGSADVRIFERVK